MLMPHSLHIFFYFVNNYFLCRLACVKKKIRGHPVFPMIPDTPNRLLILPVLY